MVAFCMRSNGIFLIPLASVLGLLVVVVRSVHCLSNSLDRRLFLLETSSSLLPPNKEGTLLYNQKDSGIPDTNNPAVGRRLPLQEQEDDDFVDVDGMVLMIQERGYGMKRLARDLLECQSMELPTCSLRVLVVYADEMTPSKLGETIDNLPIMQSAATAAAVPLIIIGHEMGGLMAIWSAMRSLLPSDVPGSNPKVIPTAVISMNGILDLKWAIEQGQIRHPNAYPWLLRTNFPPHSATIESDNYYKWISPIDILPPATKSMRTQQASIRNLRPPSSNLYLIHCDDDPIIPVAQSIRFTVAACTGGIPLDLHRLKHSVDPQHTDCLKQLSYSWNQVAKSIILQEISTTTTIESSSSSSNSNSSASSNDMMMTFEESLEPQRMMPTIREEKQNEIVIKTRRQI